MKIENGVLSLNIDEHGAEMTSLIDLRNGVQMLWQGDAKYWKGQSPILFPTVGRVNDDTIRHNGLSYPMSKHGFVRNMDFSVTHRESDNIEMMVESDNETRKHFPFGFRFTVRYELVDNKVIITFRTENTDANEVSVPFHLGAHPAFNIPEWNETDEIHGYLGFNIKDKLVSNGLKPGGLLWPEGSFDVPLDGHSMLALTNETFQCDTILDTRGVARTCVLYNKGKEAVVKVDFDSPVLALWTPCSGKAPFVCIEPWWGCCDRFDYEGEFSQRTWTNHAKTNEANEISYTITII